MAFLISIAFVSFLHFGSVTKKAHVTGILVPGSGSLTINAPNAGILVRNYVVEGQHVTVGQPLFALATERQGSQGELTALVAQQLQSRALSLQSERSLRIAQHQERKTLLNQRLQTQDKEALQLEQEIDLGKRRLELAQQSQVKFETLQASGYVSAMQAQQQQENVIEMGARLNNLGRSAVQLHSSRQDIEGELRSLSTALATDLAQIQRSQAMLEQEIAENNSRKSVLITAPHDGTVTTVTYQEGQAINAGQPLATLIPQTAPGKAAELEVYLYAPSRTAGFVARGQQVLIRYQAFPYQKFGLQKGVVSDVSTTPFAPTELPQNLASTVLANAQQSIMGSNGNEALYRIKVLPVKQTIQVYGREQPLKPGMTLEADVIQDSRKIWEWIAEPLLAMTK